MKRRASGGPAAARYGRVAGVLGWIVAAFLLGRRSTELRTRTQEPAMAPAPEDAVEPEPEPEQEPEPEPEPAFDFAPEASPPSEPEPWRAIPPAPPRIDVPQPAVVFAPPKRPRGSVRGFVTSAALLLVSIAAGLLLNALVTGDSQLKDLPAELAGDKAKEPPPEKFSSRSLASKRDRRYTTTIARSRGRTIRVFNRPKSGKVKLKLARRKVSGKSIPLVFVVDGRRGDWLKVRLPVRPNGSTGWVRRRDVALAATVYRVKIDIVSKRLRVYKRNKLVIKAPIGTGTAVTPTPKGRYFVTDLIRPPTDDGLYGAFAFGLSAYSPVLTTFNGGPGQIGVHGTNQPKALGAQVSKGCIRVRNDVIRRLAKILPLGTPVEILGEKPKAKKKR